MTYVSDVLLLQTGQWVCATTLLMSRVVTGYVKSLAPPNSAHEGYQTKTFAT